MKSSCTPRQLQTAFKAPCSCALFAWPTISSCTRSNKSRSQPGMADVVTSFRRTELGSIRPGLTVSVTWKCRLMMLSFINLSVQCRACDSLSPIFYQSFVLCTNFWKISTAEPANERGWPRHVSFWPPLIVDQPRKNVSTSARLLYRVRGSLHIATASKGCVSTLTLLTSWGLVSSCRSHIRTLLNLRSINAVSHLLPIGALLQRRASLFSP